MTRPTMRRLAIGLGCGASVAASAVLLRIAVAQPPPPPSEQVNLSPDFPAPKPPEQAPAAAQWNGPQLPTQASLPRSADGRHYPLLPAAPAEIAALLVAVEASLRSPTTLESDHPRLGHQQQVIYRVLSHKQGLSDQVRRHIPEAWLSIYDRHLAARREFLAMHRGGRKPTALPAWRIIDPEPAENLIGYYKKAEAATGIAWEVLAAVNLVETAMGRIDGVSVANAQGPMQFLPTTWAERGIGQGDIRDPHDAIQAAARYLVRRGGLQDIRKGLWGYNNSDHYGEAVLLYASMIEEDPKAYIGLYNWEVHFGADAGDLWLPVGYDQRQKIDVGTYLSRVPASAPPAGSSGY